MANRRNRLSPLTIATRILITYVTAGAGHRRAAEAIAQALSRRAPDADVRCVDLLDYAPGRFRAFYAWSYLFLVRRLAWLWRISYRLLDWDPVYRCVQPLRRAWNLFIVRRFIRELRMRPPDLVVATHFLPADVCSAGRAAGWLRAPLIVVVTDLYPHRFWISTDADLMVTATDAGLTVLTQSGVTSDRIRVVGIPVGAAFEAPVDRTALRRRFGLQPTRRTVLVTSGGTTVGQFERVVEALLSLEPVRPGALQLLVVCGEDEPTRARLSRRAASSTMPMRVFGFVDYMADLMGASDLVVTKGGGLTISEALGRGLPLVLYHIIPGQEQMNASYVEQHGAGIIARRPSDVAQAVRRFLDDPGLAESIRQAAQVLGRPDAADVIVTKAILPLLRRGS